MNWIILKLVDLLNRIHPKAPELFIKLMWVSAVLLVCLYFYGLMEGIKGHPIFIIRKLTCSYS